MTKMPIYLKAVRDKETGGIMFLDQFTAMYPDGPEVDPDRYEAIWLMEIEADQVPIGYVQVDGRRLEEDTNA